MDLGFVILHYKTYEMTEICVETLLSTFNNFSFQIVVVDNGSSNESGERLTNKYFYEKKVDVILNNQNVGFANGNNIGFNFIREKYQPYYIVVMNNDVLIKDREFLGKIRKQDSIYKFAVLGPDIQNPLLKNHQNPERLVPRSTEAVKKRIKSFERKCKHPFLFYILSKIKDIIIIDKTVTKTNYNFKYEWENVVLHGACYIFSPKFWKTREKCFNPKTFLYHEEDILFYECQKAHLKMIYSPEIYVEHLEDVSTNASFKSGYKKAYMRNKYLKDSANILLDILENDWN